MQRFLKVFKQQTCKIIGMIHVDALPGTPRYASNWKQTIENAIYEASLYKKHQLDAVLIENMHDIPYVPERLLGAEIVACMTRLGRAVREVIPQEIPCGVQVLACGNKQALAIARASQLQFIRAEGFVFGHVADEGFTDACAGDLLRYRKLIDAEDVLIFTDLKKKHSSHAITADVSLLETAHAAEFFMTDGIIITGTATGHAASPEDLQQLSGRVKVPLIIGSGVTRDNIDSYYKDAHAVIIGSHFKRNGNWLEEISEPAVDEFMQKICQLRHSK
uniref:RE21901p n=1 Tax=Drosophila melanogaster TaxID=7227 RepID=Q8SZ27_DROME|nr:RE21901p [Drosophila melanogaster]